MYFFKSNCSVLVLLIVYLLSISGAMVLSNSPCNAKRKNNNKMNEKKKKKKQKEEKKRNFLKKLS
jgi:hypothetical protein